MIEDAQPQDTDETELAEERVLRCRACDHVLAPEDAVRPIAGRGPRHTFVNPAGVVHELVTVIGATGVRDHGERTEDFSWFVGWSWRYAACGGCRAFLGWCFEAVEPGREPARFHGLRVQALT